MTNWLRLIRFPNLIIILLTMLGVRYGLLETLWLNTEQMLNTQGLGGIFRWKLHMPGADFALLCISVLCIAAGGYIINDYFDVKADRINRPERLFIESSFSRRTAMTAHIVLSMTGLLLSFGLAWRMGNLKLAAIQLFSVLSLWFYSSHLKRQMLTGNLLIAFLAALVPVTIGVYEFGYGVFKSAENLNLLIPGAGNALILRGVTWVVGFALFAFLTNLIREMIKDIEDMEGDRAAGCRTIPIVIGENYSRYIILFLLFFTAGLLGFILENLIRSEYTLLFWYILLMTELPLLVMVYLVWKANEKKEYTLASLVCKVCIVAGVISMFLFRYT